MSEAYGRWKSLRAFHFELRNYGAQLNWWAWCHSFLLKLNLLQSSGMRTQQDARPFDLIHNDRKTQKITISQECDAAFAEVDIVTLWKSKAGEKSHWLGRTGKSYVKTADVWKMINQVGVFIF
jgi:hypothetical protein